MKIIPLLLTTIAVAGCAHVQRVTVLTHNPWDSGEHKQCTFLMPNSLACDRVGPVPVLYADVTGSDLAQADYDVLFSVRPSQYALWDCQKNESAISCQFLKKPTRQAVLTIASYDRARLVLQVEYKQTLDEQTRALQQCQTLPFAGDQAKCAIPVVQSTMVKLKSQLARLNALQPPVIAYQ